MRSLEKAPEDRFQRASEFAAAFRYRYSAATWLESGVSPGLPARTRFRPPPRFSAERGNKLVTNGNLAREQTDIPTAGSPRPVVPSPPTRAPQRSEAPTDTGITSSTDLDDPTLPRKRALLRNELRAYFEDTTPDKAQLPPPPETPRKSEEPENSRILPIREEETPQTGIGRQPSHGDDTSASKAPPADRTSFTTGARPGRRRRKSRPQKIGRYRFWRPIRGGNNRSTLPKPTILSRAGTWRLR